MDSPDKSSYIPLSLSDTLTQPKRTYTSRPAAATQSGAPARPGPRPSHAHSSSFSRERGELARRDAQAMMEALGMGTPGPSASEVDATPRPAGGRPTLAHHSAAELSSVRAQLGDRDEELALLRREKSALVARVEALEREAKTRGEAAAAAALDPRQLEELERQFEAQETLLSGYQKEAEKAAGELDRMRRQQRRLTDYLEKTYGPAWADDLGLSDRAGGGIAAASPAVRTKLVARASLLHTPTSFGSLTRSATLGALPIPESPEREEGESSQVLEDGGPADAPLASSTAGGSPAVSPGLGGPPPALLVQHLDSVQTLLRAMEARLIARDAELAATEQRAREEGAKLAERGTALQRLVERQRAKVGVEA